MAYRSYNYYEKDPTKFMTIGRGSVKQDEVLDALRMAQPYAVMTSQAAQPGGNALSGLISGAGVGASIGSIVPGIGTAVGGALGGLIGGVGGFFGGRKKKEEPNVTRQRELTNIGLEQQNRLLDLQLSQLEQEDEWMKGLRRVARYGRR